MKKFVLFAIIGLFCVASVKAASVEEVSAALQKAARTSSAAAEQKKYTGFNPQLTQEQMNKIPALMKKVTERLHNAGYETLTEANVVEGLSMYFELVMYSNRLYTSEDLKRMYNKEVEATVGDYHRHALMYALVKMFPQDSQSLGYNANKYPKVANWKYFHELCQRYMDDVYITLEQLPDCSWDVFKGVLGNIM